MPKFYVSFGCKYRHEPHPALGFQPRLPDLLGFIEAETYAQARIEIVARLGSAWAFMYDEETVQKEYHPAGEFNLEIYGKRDDLS